VVHNAHLHTLLAPQVEVANSVGYPLVYTLIFFGHTGLQLGIIFRFYALYGVLIRAVRTMYVQASAC
jgi:hypothetical protein